MIYDKDFLLELDNYTEKEIYARIISLNFEELPVELIEGKVTGGSINIDGTSAVRRTFSLSVVANEIDINEYLWGLKTKCKVEIGVKNVVNAKYPDIIWFKQGVYVITAFNISHNTNSYTISISGKDKMCLLNGELGGNLTSSVDFGVETFYDLESQTTTYTHIPIKKIIYESLHTYGNELYSNIIINDLDEAAVELLDYKGDKPMYLLMKEDGADENTNFTMNGETMVCLDGKFDADGKPIRVHLDNDLNKKEGLQEIIYDTRLDIENEIIEDKSTRIYYNEQYPDLYTVALLTYGKTAGYRITELTYPGDLISNIGESLTSIYDKIVSMLGTYEYFYDIDGRFIFLKKRIYTGTSWNNLLDSDDGTYAESAALSSASIYTFNGSNLITSFLNSPNLTNLKNDYSIWGTRESISGAEIPIHYRYAIDIKPNIYTLFSVSEDDVLYYNTKHPEAPLKTRLKEDCTTFTIADYDWRELIYLMAADYYVYNLLDDFLVKVAAANPLYLTGKTGYELYYIDLLGFWRQLYNPTPEPSYQEQEVEEELLVDSIDDIYIKGHYEKVEDISKLSAEERMRLYALIEVDGDKELHPLLDAIPIAYYDSIQDDGDNTTIDYSNEFYIVGRNGTHIPVNSRTKDIIDKEELYVMVDDRTYKKLIEADDYVSKLSNIYKYNYDEKFYAVAEFDKNLLLIYYKNGKILTHMILSPLTIEGKKDNTTESLPISTYITYYKQGYEYYRPEDNSKTYWSKDIVMNPEGMNFWIDFMDATSELGKYSVPTIGDRTKVVNDKDVKVIYYRKVPNIIFITPELRKQIDITLKTGYGILNITKDIENLFNISSQGKSAQDKIDELLYAHSYCVENITILAIPIYYLEPNTRITVRDDNSKINGDYTISRITLPLAYNGTMSITATKIPERLL